MPRRRLRAPPDLVLRPAGDADRDAIAQIWFDGWMSNGIALRPDQAKLDQIFVASGRQGVGVGRALFEAARAAMPEGFTPWTHGENHRARRFYEACRPHRHEHGTHPGRGHAIVTYWFAGA